MSILITRLTVREMLRPLVAVQRTLIPAVSSLNVRGPQPSELLMPVGSDRAHFTETAERYQPFVPATPDTFAFTDGGSGSVAAAGGDIEPAQAARSAETHTTALARRSKDASWPNGSPVRLLAGRG